MYRPPNNNPTPLEALAEDLEKLTSSDNLPIIILAGDFNLPSIDWSTDNIKPGPRYGKEVNEKMMEIYQNNCLHQLIDTPTHGDNILDLKPTPAKYKRTWMNLQSSFIAIRSITQR